MNEIDAVSLPKIDPSRSDGTSESLLQQWADWSGKTVAINQCRDREQLKNEARTLLRSAIQLYQRSGWDVVELSTTTELASESPAIDSSASSPKVKSNKRIALYVASFDPPTCSQREDVQRLHNAGFDEVAICPIGPRQVAGEHQHASPPHRAALVSLGFRGLDGVVIDYDDISHNRNTSIEDLEAKHGERGEVWHVLDWDQVPLLENCQNANFVIFHPPGHSIHQDGDHGNRVDAKLRIERNERHQSAEVRRRVYGAGSICGLVVPLVESYIERHKLFIPYSSQRYANFTLAQPRLKIVADPRNPKSTSLAEQYRDRESDDPELILVLGGDGTMLHAIREYWQLRIPFIGLNTGHLGFLMNERLPDDLSNLELVSHSLPLLRVDAENAEGVRTWGLAFSDVWIERADGQAAWLQLDVDGETRVSKVVGDGMLIATASGSTAYARAMGAVPIPLNTPAITLAGSNIFQPRFWKPMTLPDDSVIKLSSLDRSGKRPLRGFVDGTPIGQVQQITVRRSLTASIEMAFTREFDPSARLLRSLFPPDEVGAKRL
jgi:NAD+ kinase